MTDRDIYALRGPVRTCRLQRTWYSRQCGPDACETEERTDITDLEFRPDGSLARRCHVNPDGSKWNANYDYDATGRPTAIRTEGQAGLVDLLLHEYDSAGRLVRINSQPHGGPGRVAENYEYDSAGRKKKTQYIDLAALPPDTEFFWATEGSGGGYAAPGATTLTTFYNLSGQPIDLHFQDRDGRLVSRVEFSYDRDGNMIEEAQTNTAETLRAEMLASLNLAQLETVKALFGANGEPLRTTHQYNEQGRRVGTRSRMGPLGEDGKTMTYNDRGDQIGETLEHQEREYGIDEEGRFADTPASESRVRSEANFRYEYDTQGNWVTKSIESRGAVDRAFTLSSIERRTLSYFE
ncbi:MAG: hypothetical protein ACKV2U_33520 [Bryobacteraceae bacterium]